MLRVAAGVSTGVEIIEAIDSSAAKEVQRLYGGVTMRRQLANCVLAILGHLNAQIVHRRMRTLKATLPASIDENVAANGIF